MSKKIHIGVVRDSDARLNPLTLIDQPILSVRTTSLQDLRILPNLV